MLFHFKYLYEATGRNVQAGSYTVEIDDPDQAGEVSKAIDALFENSDAQTHTETEAAFAAGFLSMAGNLALLLNTIGLAVSFTILLVTANTMSMAVRERRTEIAVLKTLGFGSGTVMGLIVAESLLLGVLGGALGHRVQPRHHVPAHQRSRRQGRAGRDRADEPVAATPPVALMGFGVALFLGLAAGFVPA